MDLTSELLDQALPQAAAATGMVRISRGNQQRWIWPVHLPGWIALGWQVSHPGTASDAAAVPGVGEPVALTSERGASDSTEQASEESSMADAIAPTNGRRRGRKPKALQTTPAEPEADPAGSVISAQPDALESLVEADASPAGDISPDDAANDAAAQPEITSVLPDDLLSEAF